jgi:hypothetical protein
LPGSVKRVSRNRQQKVTEAALRRASSSQAAPVRGFAGLCAAGLTDMTVVFFIFVGTGFSP